MRNATLFAALMMLGLTPNSGTAQEAGPAIKVDAEASEASRRQGSLPSSAQSANAGNEGTATSSRPALPEVLANWKGGSLTLEELSSTLTNRRPADLQQVTAHQFSFLPRKQQEDVVKRLAWERILLEKARAAGITENTPAVANAVDIHEQALLNRIYYQNEIVPALNELSEDVAREYYEENKDEKFTQPALTVVRALHVSTYEMVTAEEGDTLRKLAEEISGDAGAASRILDATAPFYLRQTPTELEDEVLSSPLKAGEVLLVPLAKDAVSSATKLAEDLRKQLADGRSLDEVVASTAEADYVVSATEPIRFSSAAGYWDELTRAANSLEGTSVSEVVNTPVGLNIVVVEDRTTTQIIEFDTVKDQLLEQVSTDENQRRQTVEKTREKVLARLWEKFKVQLNRDLLSRPNYQSAEITSDTVVVQIGDFRYSLEEFLHDLRLTGKDWGQLTEAERTEVVKVAPKVTNHLTAMEARDLNLDKTTEFKEAIQGIIDSEIVNEYRKQTLDPEQRRVTDDELRAYYNDHIDRYTSAAQVTVREISKRINMTLPASAKAEAIQKAKASLSEIKTRIKSEEDFAQLARRESEAISTRSRGGLIGTVADDFRGEAFKNQLRQLQPGSISEPFLYGSEVMIIRLDERTAPTVQPFEEVRRRVMLDYARTEPSKQKNQEMNQVLEEAGFKLNF